MTEARVASVDVYILRRGDAGWETLLLQRAEDLLMGAPSEVTAKQLRELHIRLDLPKK